GFLRVPERLRFEIQTFHRDEGGRTDEVDALAQSRIEVADGIGREQASHRTQHPRAISREPLARVDLVDVPAQAAKTLRDTERRGAEPRLGDYEHGASRHAHTPPPVTATAASR